jgi:hypothetical protein
MDAIVTSGLHTGPDAVQRPPTTCCSLLHFKGTDHDTGLQLQVRTCVVGCMHVINRRWREQLKSADAREAPNPFAPQLAVLRTSVKAMHMHQQQKFTADALGWLKATEAVCYIFRGCLLSQLWGHNTVTVAPTCTGTLLSTRDDAPYGALELSRLTCQSPSHVERSASISTSRCRQRSTSQAGQHDRQGQLVATASEGGGGT